MKTDPQPIVQTQSPALPVKPEERLVFVDILRGFAIFGILVANMAGFSGHNTNLLAPQAAIDHWVLVLIRFFITAKFYSLFSFLFGWGLSVQMARARERGARFSAHYLRRLLVLLLIGVLHSVFIWSGDILVVYALLGLLLFLMRNRSERTILTFALVLLLLSIFLSAPWKVSVEIISAYERLTAFLRLELASTTAYSSGSYLQITQFRIAESLQAVSRLPVYFGNIFSMFLLGLWVGKRRIFQDVDRHSPWLVQVLVVGLVVGVIGNALNVWLLLHPGDMPAAWFPQSHHQLLQHTAYTLGAPAFMLFYVSGMVLLLRRKYWQSLLNPLANVGRMALSNYLFQSVIATLLFYNYGLGLYGEISPTVGLVLTVFIFLLQVRISAWWFDRYHYGPVEWLWRFLTYGSVPLSPADTKGASGEEAYPIQAFYLSLKRLHPAWILSLTWVLLLVWGGLLIYWNQQTNLARQVSTIIAEIAATAIPTPSAPQSNSAAQAGETGQADAPVISFQNIPYLPRNAAARGDTEALVGAFDIDQALYEIEVLTGEPYWGRYAGSPQGWAAGDYLASLFSGYGLQPLGNQGTYFQEFSVLYTPLEKTPRLYMESSSDSAPEAFIAYQDFSPVVRWYAGSGEGSGQVYWMNRCTNEDFAAREVVGKVLLCLPDSVPHWLEQSSRRALEHGAAALLFLRNPADWPPDFGWSFKDVWVPEPLPVFYVYPDMVSRLLAGSEKTLEDLLADEAPFPVERTVGFEIQTMQGDACPGTECIARNVLGILPGRDPAYAHEAIILGAHYDHMGQTPSGLIWHGANDDASGVAVLLEIARSWQEQGYVPKRSVIFAAWDAEELGLLGSIQYVQNPRFPLENTIAMIQLDMVGAGSATLDIDGSSALGERIKYIAETFDVDTRLSDTGGSDHVPFLSAGIPASAMIWEIPSDGRGDYHRPDDTVEMIDAERLLSAARIAESTVLNLVESEPSIQEMLVARARAAQQGNLGAFLSFSHPDQVQNDRYWFEDLQSLRPRQVRLEAVDLFIAGKSAAATIKMDVDTPDPSENITRTLTARIPVSLTYEPSGWKWSGPQQVWNERDVSADGKTAFQVSFPPGKEDGVSGLRRSAIEQYQQLTNLLGVSPEVQAKVLVLEDEEALWGSTALSQPADRIVSVDPGQIKLVYCEAISTSLQLQDSLVLLSLAEAGVSEELAPWLWHGLPLVVRGYAEPVAMQTRFLPNLFSDLSQGSSPSGMVHAWAATAYLQERLGWSRLGEFVIRLGQAYVESGDPAAALDAALQAFVNLDAAGFEAAWQLAWKTRLETAQAALDALLSERNLAISSGDRQALLATIDRSVPNLEKEEIHWLEDYRAHPPQRYQIKGQPLAFLEGGYLLAAMTVETQLEGEEHAFTDSFSILLAPSEMGYAWAGPPMERFEGMWVDILYPSGNEAVATALLAEAEKILTRLSGFLDIPQTESVTIKLYENSASYRASISISMPPSDAVNAWTSPGESIKLNLMEGGTPAHYMGVLADQLSRTLLYQSGIAPGWLVEGVSAYLAKPYTRETRLPSSGLQNTALVEAVQRGQTPAFTEIMPVPQLTRQEIALGKLVAQDAVDYIVSKDGWLALRAILDAMAQGANLEQALQSVSGILLAQFEQNWRDSLLHQHIKAEWLEAVQAFQAEYAMESVVFLASPALKGRQAGSPGSEAAAQYIAESFAAFGLLPVGSLLTETISLEASAQPVPVVDAAAGVLSSYYQTFPISYTEPIMIPRLELLDEAGEVLLSLTYRQDFLLTNWNSCNGTISASFVWAGNQDDPGMELDGMVLLRTSTSDLQRDVTQAVSQGAAGLILTSRRWEPEDLFSKQPITPQDSDGTSIPIFELTQPGYNRLLEALGYDRQTIGRMDAFQPAGRLIRFECRPYNFETTQTFNVLGLLPGSDPYLSKEVVILGAHYDYVGDDPGGLYYSGANDNASGVAVLLEISRLLHEQDYHPKRSILFVAWGAQELGQVGSKFYVENPIFPLHETIAMIQLDGVGGGEGFNLGVQGSMKSNGELLSYIRAAEETLQETLVYTEFFNESDHTPFVQDGVPSVLISWRLANEANLPDALANAVLPERLGAAGRLIMLLLLTLGSG